MNTNTIQPKRALISVSDKTGIVELAQELHSFGVEIISTGGTAKAISEAGIPVVGISDYTGFPEIMDGRVKTLNPLVHGGILGLRDKHAEIAQQQNIKWIDLVICNLYPFAETIQKEGVEEEDVIENIDIGGPSMIRSAAKNIGWVGVIVNPNDYKTILQEIKEQNGITYATRKRLSAKAFSHTAQYDTFIANHFKQEKYPEELTFTYKKSYDLRYGENPHQSACVYKDSLDKSPNILNAEILQGKKLSYNNLGDAQGALDVVMEFETPAVSVIKHANPCGVATGGDNITEIFTRAYEADSLSAFGGVVAINRTCTKEIAEYLDKVFAEIVLAPKFENEALEIFAKKKNLRILKLGSIPELKERQTIKQINGGLLIQDNDTKTIAKEDLKFVTDKKPSETDLDTMLFAWKVLKYVKSNGILIARDNTTLGIGTGQVSRVDAVDIAISKTGDRISGSILASDAFFPFRDSIDKIAESGIKTIIQPGGSVKDEDVIKACNEHGIAMIFTGNRCFRH